MREGRTTDGRGRDLCVMEMRLPVIETISEPFCICFSAAILNYLRLGNFTKKLT